jgi:hypothetical protein
MGRVVTDMAQPKTGLSPEWDRWFDETFADLVSSDEDLTRGEFAARWAAGGAPPAPPEAAGPPADPAAPAADG